jgi:ApaG protein
MDQFFSYAAETEGIVVRVQPHYAEEASAPEDERWVWHYHVRIENGGERTIQLVDRHWIIIDARGRREDVSGMGVVGEQPVIEPGDAFDYVSACPLETPSGHMEGSYGMVDEGGVGFRIAIPAFDLVSPSTRRHAH